MGKLLKQIKRCLKKDESENYLLKHVEIIRTFTCVERRTFPWLTIITFLWKKYSICCFSFILFFFFASISCWAFFTICKCCIFLDITTVNSFLNVFPFNYRKLNYDKFEHDSNCVRAVLRVFVCAFSCLDGEPKLFFTLLHIMGKDEVFKAKYTNKLTNKTIYEKRTKCELLQNVSNVFSCLLIPFLLDHLFLSSTFFWLFFQYFCCQWTQKLCTIFFCGYSISLFEKHLFLKRFVKKAKNHFFNKMLIK